MVRLDIGGFPKIDIEPGKPGEIVRVKDNIRRRMRGGSSVRLHWNTTTPRVVLTSDTDEFDPTTISQFQEEGFQLSYLAYAGQHADYIAQLQHLQDPLELGEKYAIVAYGDAAALVLEACMKTMPKLVAVVAYYPPYLPKGTTSFPPTLDVQIHLASSQRWGTRFPSFRYDNTEPGFAEHDLEEFDAVGAGLAWTRSLGLLRNAFDFDGPDLEAVRDQFSKLKFSEKDADKTVANLAHEATVDHVPTMTGGAGEDTLRRFYGEFFTPGVPSDMRVRLLSRTVGVDRVVDEMFVSFTHSVDMPWILPGVPPTDKKVEVVMVSVVGVRGGKVFSERVHWDQATVLVQIGLLDPKVVPDSFKTAEQERRKEVKKLPVCGREAARKVLNDNSAEHNQLIPNWSRRTAKAEDG